MISGARGAQDSTFTLESALRLARQNARVLAMRAAAEATAAREAGARRPPDPVLQLGAMNFGVPDLRTDMPASMVPFVQLMQMVPFPGKLGLSGRIAEHASAAAAADADEMGWEMRAEVAGLFWELWAADRQLAVMRETLALLGDFEQIARAMYASGEGRQTDVLRAGVEAARMRADLVRMEVMRRAAAARLNAMLQRPADTPVPRTADSPLPLVVPGADTLRAWAAGSRARLRSAQARVERSAHEAALMRREIWPDLTVGLQYGQRPMEEGTERMASVMVGFSLPVFAGSRQYRMRDEAEAMRRMAGAELAEARAEVDAAITEQLAELERSRSLVQLYRAEVLPQARAAVESALSAYRVGSVDFLMLLDGQMARNRYEQELHGLVAEYGRARARLESVVGREIPGSGPTLVEVR
jgi:outer membrane protein TolC